MASSPLGADVTRVPASIVADNENPRGDPGTLTRPAAVALGGVRIR
jgi:hypothetical protein